MFAARHLLEKPRELLVDMCCTTKAMPQWLTGAPHMQSCRQLLLRTRKRYRPLGLTCMITPVCRGSSSKVQR